MQDKVMSVLRRFAEENGYEYRDVKGFAVNSWCYHKRIGRSIVICWYYNDGDVVCQCRYIVGGKKYYGGYGERVPNSSEQGILAVLKRCLDKSVVNAFKEVLYNR